MKFQVLLFVLLIAGCTSVSSKCGVTNCHGLDIVCGSNIPEVCTTLYQLGDFCRSYVNCSVVNSSCVLVSNPQFVSCRSCVSECERLYDSIEAFDCESACRDRMSKFCVQVSDCACGKNSAGECFYGSKELVNVSEQCPDYCTGIAGHLEIKCVSNECVQVMI